MENMRRRSSSSSSTFKPHFFKVLFKDFENSLRIPDGFLKHLAEESLEIATLVGPSGNSWYVKVNSTNAGMYLEDGWATFLNDHSLKKGEFLVFRYDGNMKFMVTMYGTSECLLEEALFVKPSQVSSFREGRRGRGRPRKVTIPDSVRTKHKNVLERNNISQRLEKLELRTPHSRGQLKSPEEGRAEKAVNLFTSNFPYFLSVIKPYNVHPPFNMLIPVRFLREHLLGPNETMISMQEKGKMVLELRNEKGMIWKVPVYIRKYQVTLLGGWKLFLQYNRLKVGDYCVFELVDHLVMVVHIFRC